MKLSRYKLATFIIPGTGALFFTFILAQSHHNDRTTLGAVTVISGARPDALSTPLASKYPQVRNIATQATESLTGPTEPVRQLHDSIAAEEQDQRWAADVKRDVADIVARVPYISSDHLLRCGTIRCELSVAMQPGISAENASYVTSRFYLLPDTGQTHHIQVEGVFPSSDNVSSLRKLTIIYMRAAQ